MADRPMYEGDPAHPEHDRYLLEIGRATYAAASLAGIAFDVSRIHGGYDSTTLYDDVLGALERKLRSNPSPLEGMDDFLELLHRARIVRNDLLHALPVLHGLHRRRSKDPYYVRNFFTVDSVRQAVKVMERAVHVGNDVLYVDGGDVIRRWYERAG